MRILLDESEFRTPLIHQGNTPVYMRFAIVYFLIFCGITHHDKINQNLFTGIHGLTLLAFVAAGGLPC
jgi:hypothetical protein